MRTDQQSLKFLLEQRLVTQDHQKWLVKLLGYDFEIQYRAGHLNREADALSRMGPVECAVVTTTTWVDWEIGQRELAADPFLGRVISDLEQGTPVSGFEYNQGRLRYKGRLVLFASSVLIPQLLDAYHGSPVGGHSGELRTYQRLRGDLYWVGMKSRVRDFVRA